MAEGLFQLLSFLVGAAVVMASLSVISYTGYKRRQDAELLRRLDRIEALLRQDNGQVPPPH